MKPTVRHMLLAGLLAISIAAALAVSRQGEALEVAEAVTREARPAVTPNTKAGSAQHLVAQIRAPISATDRNPFSLKNWYVPPAPVAAAPEDLPKPTAPPLPFTYKGKLGGLDQPEVFYLAKGNESYVVAVGEMFADSYKLEAARDGVLTIKYLPLPTTQTLRYGIAQ